MTSKILQVGALLLVVVAVLGSPQGGVYYSVKDGNETKIAQSRSPPANWLAKAVYSDKIEATGWATLEIETNPALSDGEQVYEAGYLEGYLTQKRIYQYWQNTMKSYCAAIPSTCRTAIEFLKENAAWTYDMIEERDGYDPWWHQAGLFYAQLNGLVKGYAGAVTDPKEQIDEFDLYLLNMALDLDTLTEAFASTEDEVEQILQSKKPGHCTAVIKILPDYQDILVGHATWDTYNQMLRFIKKYNFTIHQIPVDGAPVVPGNIITFTSYPGLIFSGDDFNVISSGLVTTETTNDMYSGYMFQYLKAFGTVMQPIRSTIANRLAASGQDWRANYQQWNSGTYNNQWLIVDYKLFTPGSKTYDNLVWIVEQIPALVYSTDVTPDVFDNTYFASYNVPYFDYVYNITGYAERASIFGDWFTYDSNPRAKILKRDHTQVTDELSLLKLLRSNNYESDPYSTCDCTPTQNACNALSARCDLNPADGKYPFPGVQHRMFGGIDAKVVSLKGVETLNFIAVSGPTTENDLPAFQWSKVADDDDIPHIGQPEKFHFSPIATEWKL